MNPKTEETFQKLLGGLLEPGVHHLVVRHDSTCPGAHGKPELCNCSPDLEVVAESEALEIVVANNKARRAAAEKKAGGGWTRPSAQKTGAPDA
jgi:hypothetical protein